MRLQELALKVNTAILHSDKELTDVKDFFLTSGKLLQSIEGNKFKLIKNANNIGMFSNNGDFVGFLQFSEIDSKILSLDKIFILPEFRNQKIAKTFVFWFKSAMKKSVFIGGAVFADGQNFVKSLFNDPKFDVVGFNVRTKERTEFDADKFFDSRHYTGALVENLDEFFGMYDNSLPGQPKGSNLICLEMFTNES